MPRKQSSGKVRIIGGQWRSRRLPVADLPGLRPSGDRARETLFNWLQPELPGAVCADLYAGSGALGFEAASRDAASVVLVERHPLAVEQLRENISTLEAPRVTVHAGDEGIRFLLVSGKPLKEPVAWHGPIVMNTRDELITAVTELQTGKFIKESAGSWGR